MLLKSYLIATLLPTAIGFTPGVAFATSSISQICDSSNRRFGLFRRLASSSTTESTASATTAEKGDTPPSWDELSTALSSITEKEEEEPLLTLYRDTNGWCPFCERVWICLHVKNIPYRERLINLQNKPDWYKELVPTTLVPAVAFHDDIIQEEASSPERRIVWESRDVMKALDDTFPETPRLVWDEDEAYKTAQDMNTELASAGFAYVYASRNDTLTEEDKADRKAAFESKLDELDQSLLAVERSEGSAFFRLGSEFSGIDAEMIPMLERWKYQLPLTHNGFDVLENRKGLQQWWGAMENYLPYAERVAGDEYSWTAVTSTFLRYFGGGEEKPEVMQMIEEADSKAMELMSGFSDALEDDVERSAVLEAVTKLITNYEAVVSDCTNSDPLSQKHFPRAEYKVVADVTLRYVASLLLKCVDASDGKEMVGIVKETPLVQVPDNMSQDASLAARTVAQRLCVPRDMGAPAAKVLRGVLASVAQRLEQET